MNTDVTHCCQRNFGLQKSCFRVGNATQINADSRKKMAVFDEDF